MIRDLFIIFLAAAASASILPGTTEVTMAGLLCLGSASLWPIVATATAGSVAGGL
jgi:membrane protein YqaA with SNARE-associated domain